MQAAEKAWQRDALPRGAVLNGYRIESIIGRGGFGLTYLAVDELDQGFAIKECFPRQFACRDGLDVAPTGGADEEPFLDCRGRFLREAKALLHLGSMSGAGDGVVKVITFFQAHGTAYIVMELLRGRTLDDLIKERSDGIPEARLKDIMLRVLHALGCVHDAGLLHRDIKPANIFLRENERPVLIDFGAARSGGHGQTVTFTQVFSEGYAPIEQFSGTVQGPSADIYAFGATFYKAIGGRAIDAFTRHQAVLRGKSDPQVPAKQVGAGRYAPGLLAALDAALQIAPEGRPQSVQELTSLLNEDFEALTVAVRSAGAPQAQPTSVTRLPEVPPTLGPTEERSVGPSKPRVGMIAASVAAGLVAVLVVGGILYAGQQSRREAETKAAQAEAEAKKAAEEKAHAEAALRAAADKAAAEATARRAAEEKVAAEEKAGAEAEARRAAEAKAAEEAAARRAAEDKAQAEAAKRAAAVAANPPAKVAAAPTADAGYEAGGAPKEAKRISFRKSDGSSYSGMAVRGVPEGQGTMVTSDGDRYEGTFHAGKLSGTGVYSWADGDSYSGTFADGTPNGKGTFRYASGVAYEGEVVDGEPQGQGSFRYPNGNKYVGEVRNGAPDGYGTLTHADGTTHTAQWSEGRPSN